MERIYQQIDGELNAAGLRFGVVVSRFNSLITEQLLAGCLDTIRRHGGDPEQVTVVRVPGSFEIPPVAQRLSASGKVDAVICLGAVIRGDTAHFEFIAGQSVKGIAEIQLNANVPVIYGVITPDTLEQAIERAGTKAGNKGSDAAVSAIEMASVYRQLRDL